MLNLNTKQRWTVILQHSLLGAMFTFSGSLTRLSAQPTGLSAATQDPGLTFAAITQHSFGDYPFVVSASSNSSGWVSYSVVSGPATVTGRTVTLTGTGVVVLGASQAARGGYSAASVTTSFNVPLKPQAPVLTFAPIPAPTAGDPAFPVIATSTSSAPITYTVVSGPATITGSAVSPLGAGTVILRASQVAATGYTAGSNTTSFVVAPQANAFSFIPIPSQTFGGRAFEVGVNTKSTGWVYYSVVSGPATVAGRLLTLTGTGQVVLSANQLATGMFAASSATTSFSVSSTAPLAFNAITPPMYGDAPFSVSATSASSGPIAYTVMSGPATISGSMVSVTGLGTVVLGATQAAFGGYGLATATTHFVVAPQPPALSFATIAPKATGSAPFQVSVTSPSAGAVTYSVASGPATISGSTVTITGTGTVILSASQAASGNFASATTTTSFNIGVPNAVTTVAAAARLLDQSTFGPTSAAIAHVQAVGLDGYIEEQFAAPPTTMAPINTVSPPAFCTPNSLYNCVETEWWNSILYGSDQLRQRVAFAFSEMFVVSTRGVNVLAIPEFQNALVNDAFGNFSTLLKDVTISPAMGAYLNMLHSPAPDPGKIANENFARENMQLFTIGTNLLNADGTLQLDGSGNPIPAYTESQVEAFARAYTGWTYADSVGGSSTSFPNRVVNYTSPLAPVESAHDTNTKTLLNNIVVPGGQTARQDLDSALSNLFNHPNTGPFVCRQLIQHLVASNPSPAYIARVAAVFADNGAGVRGDLQAVVRAILLDPEARAGDVDPSSDGGHLREPILFISDVIRGLGMTNTAVGGSTRSLSIQAGMLNQWPYMADSVFNFFHADYILPGTSLNAPEFGIENTAQVMQRLSFADAVTIGYLSDYRLDLSATGYLGSLATDPAALVDTLSTIFMHGQMPTSMRSSIISAITARPSNAQRARFAVYLVITSPQYNVIH